ncbi:MAG: hypothetical protein AAGA84_02610, partial [Pseudomonadota bacterium]
KKILLFVHGWSVTDTDTYGGLPDRLRNESKAHDLGFTVKHVYLSRYISFRDEVTIPDIARGFEAAIRKELEAEINAGARFVCITHSTGGPVIRDWWHRYYENTSSRKPCPMSHLIMLAPANFGSALAQLGKGRISRLQSWLKGVEPGQGVLDWLELGSAGSCELNLDWIRTGVNKMSKSGAFAFVLSGQTIDRELYDHLNAYTGETGSDGVIRVAGANLNSRYIRFHQEAPTVSKGQLQAPRLEVDDMAVSEDTAMRIVRGASHSGKDKGIMRSVYRPAGHPRGRDVVKGILQCLEVQTKTDYKRVVKLHAEESAKVQQEELIEVEAHLLLKDRIFVHDRYSMVTFRVTDDEGHPISDFDLLITAGLQNDPNLLPKGFLVDRQQNRVTPNTVTFYFNYDVMIGTQEIKHNGEVVRPASKGAGHLGFKVMPRPTDGFVHYLNCEADAEKHYLTEVLQPNQTTLIDVVLRRVVHSNVFGLDKAGPEPIKTQDFRKTKPGKDVI